MPEPIDLGAIIASGRITMEPEEHPDDRQAGRRVVTAVLRKALRAAVFL